MFRRMGELLVAAGELTAEELEDIIAEQQRVYRPFGRIAASRFQVSEEAIWTAWATQYASYCPRVRVASEHRDMTVLDQLPAAEALRRLMFPLRLHDGDLVFVTIEAVLSNALQFVDGRGQDAVSAVLWLATDADELIDTIGTAYGLPPAEVRLRKRALRKGGPSAEDTDAEADEAA